MNPYAPTAGPLGALQASLWVALGGAAGSVARYWLAEWLARAVGPGFPWGTLFANVTGSFAIGLLAGWSGERGPLVDSPIVRQLLMAGLAGGYTTFSAFSLQTLAMLQAGDVGRAGLNVAASVALCLLAVWAGWALAVAASR